MCGRFLLTSPGHVLAEQFSLSEPPAELHARYNIAPSQAVGTIDEAEATRRWVPRRWGLIPSWAKDPEIGNRLINARSETVAEKPSFRSAFRQRRCIVPADGFYEWGTGAESRRQPHCFRLEKGAPMAIAGLWERWNAASGETIETCTLLTTEADECVSAVHRRMPVLLDSGDYDAWLDPGLTDPERLQELVAGCHPDLSCVVVGPHVNSPGNDGPQCVEPAPPESEPTLFS